MAGMATVQSRELMRGDRAMLLRRLEPASPRRWVAALAMVLGIAVASILLRTWPTRSPLPTSSLALTTLSAPLLAVSAEPDVVPREVAVARRTFVRGASLLAPPPVPHAPEPVPSTPNASVPVSVAVAGAPVAGAIEARPPILLAMTVPVIVPQALEWADAPSADAPAETGPALHAAVGRVMLAAGRGIATGVRLTGASIKSAFF
jgi:hypothetical protein